MIETRFTWKWLFVVAALGLVGGVVLGLIVGWVLPISSGAPSDISSLNANAQNDYIVLVANSYAYDNDLSLAKQRLILLKDANIKTRVERLAKALTTRKDPSAANVADLAVGLGSTDSSLKVLAASVLNIDLGGQPTKVARAEIEPSATPMPTIAATDTPAATETLQATNTPTTAPTKAQPAAPKNTPKPAATNTPAVAPALTPAWTPDKSQWWSTIQFQPAAVAPGQQYWRLKSALYCEPEDVNPDPACTGLPGGGNDTSMYISLIDQNGNRTEGELVVISPQNGLSDEGTLAKVKSPSDMCKCNYSWEVSDYSVKVKGLASDVISGFCLCSVHRGWGSRAHVRYFLTFQLTTR
ncbi:MAG: hypothetical protein WCF84_05545 [Anaerolineae bacterium]